MRSVSSFIRADLYQSDPFKGCRCRNSSREFVRDSLSMCVEAWSFLIHKHTSYCKLLQKRWSSFFQLWRDEFLECRLSKSMFGSVASSVTPNLTVMLLSTSLKPLPFFCPWMLCPAFALTLVIVQQLWDCWHYRKLSILDIKLSSQDLRWDWEKTCLWLE